ncbi:MAG TPA: EamA family transporter [Candidatus Angelobacter sp.]|jgi:drug/metabolite transporter (DMT)-like permease
MAAETQANTSFGRAHLLGYIALCLIWGSTWLAIRLVVRDVPPFLAAAVRFLVAGALLLGLAFVQKRRWPADGQQWKAIFVLSLTIMAVPYGLLFWAEQHVNSSMTAVLYSAMPLTVALVTPAMMHRKVPRRAVFAMVIAFGGLLTLFYENPGTNRWAIIGGVAVLISMALSSWSVVYAKERLRDVDSVVATGLQLLFGSVFLFWATWALEAHRHARWTRTALVAIAFLTIFGSAAAFVIYYWLLKKMQPYQLSTISLIVPLIAVLAGLLDGERISLTMLAAVIVILGAVGSVLGAETEKEPEGDDLLMLRDKAQ